jgi:5-methylcytosine-specific restriction protein A
MPDTVQRGNAHVRSAAVRAYVLRRANGACEACGAPAPFKRADGSDYLEPHHITRRADGGPDHPASVAGVCPNCHRRVHHAADGATYNAALAKHVAALEAKLTAAPVNNVECGDRD